MDDHAKIKSEVKTLIKDCLETMMKKEDRFVAAFIQHKCNEKYGPAWQCIVGEDFKVAFTHDTKHFMFLEAGKLSVLLWR